MVSLVKKELTIFFLALFLASFAGVHLSWSADFRPDSTKPIQKSPQRLKADLQSVRDYISTLPLIRVGISHAPNNGHQSAGATVITRLRQLGYTGHIEVVYDNDVDGSMKRKLSFLIPPFKNDGPDEQEYGDRKISFKPRPEDNNSKSLEEVELTIMGANDNWKLNADTYKSHILLELQPLDWIDDSRVHTPGGNRLFVTALKKLGYLFDFPQPDDPMGFIQSEMSHDNSLAPKIQGLQAIVASQNKNEIAPIYGHYVKGGYQAAAYLEGLQYALQREPSLFKGGVIVPMFTNVTNLDSFKEGFKSSKTFKDLKSDPQLIFKDVKDPNLKGQCENLRAGQILLVNVGPVTKPIFEFLYAASTIPPIVEGKNSINLMQLLGRPYLPSASIEGFTFYDEHEEFGNLFNPTAGYMVAREAYNDLMDAGRDEKRIDSAAFDIGTFIIESKNPSSDLSQLFLQHQVSAEAIQYDKLIQGLLKAIKWKKVAERVIINEATKKERARLLEAQALAEFNAAKEAGDYSIYLTPAQKARRAKKKAMREARLANPGVVRTLFSTLSVMCRQGLNELGRVAKAAR